MTRAARWTLFRDVIGREVESCYALLAVIGRNWLTVTNEKGRRRLDDPDDFLRLEIQSALEADFRVRVIPVLVQGTGMPRPGELPDPLVRLSYRQAHILSDARFHADVRELIERLGRPRRDRFASLQELRQLARPWALIKNALWRPAWLNVAVTFGLIIAGIFTSRWLFLVAAAAYLTLVTVTFFSLSEARRVHELARRKPRGGSAKATNTSRAGGVGF